MINYKYDTINIFYLLHFFLKQKKVSTFYAFNFLTQQIKMHYLKLFITLLKYLLFNVLSILEYDVY